MKLSKIGCLFLDSLLASDQLGDVAPPRPPGTGARHATVPGPRRHHHHV